MRGAKSGNKGVLHGFGPVFKKECIHIFRERRPIIMFLMLNICQTLLVALGINMDVAQINTVIYDLANNQDSRALIQQFVNTDTFKIIKSVNNEADLRQAVIGGEARVGIEIPADYSKSLLAGDTASILILVDGSNSTVAREAISVSSSIALRESLKKIVGKAASANGGSSLEARTKTLFNPENKTEKFITPGQIAVAMQTVLIMLVCTTIVGEREDGTIDQLSLTPASPFSLILGKMLPYGLISFCYLGVLLTICHVVLNVVVTGSYLVLALFTLPFLVICLGLSMYISVISRTRREASFFTTLVTAPSILFSGYLFEISSMPPAFQYFSKLIPASYYVEIIRAIMVRGAGFSDLWQKALTMLLMGALMIFLAVRRINKWKW